MSERLSCPDMTVTHDGVIFPRPRPEMIDPEAIGLRMAGDMAARIRAAQYLDLSDLTKDGWTNDQIELHWPHAFQLKGAPLPPVIIPPQTTTLGREIIEQTATVIALAAFLGVLFVALGA
ncbi:MAG: hypothetical protein Q8M31_00860 [Beijerinckiaceae bacterium]|nr:hypothetical protein [Beijerinckiaceae bacterium]